MERRSSRASGAGATGEEMIKFRFKRVNNSIVAISTDGIELAVFTKTTRSMPRGSNTYYDRHRAAKGDVTVTEESYSSKGDLEAILEAAQAQLPQEFIDAQWALRKLDDNDHYAVFDFLQGLTDGGIAWFGNTDKKVKAAVKKAQKKLEFTL